MLEKNKIGDLLVSFGIITEIQLQQALEEKKKSPLKLGEILLNLNFVTEDQLRAVLSQQLHVPYINLQHYQLKPDIIKLIPEKIARRYQAIAIDDLKGAILVGMSDPSDLNAKDSLLNILKKKIIYALVRSEDLQDWINKGYGSIDEISAIASELNEEIATSSGVIEGLADVPEDEHNTPVMKLLESIFKDAIQMRASDIHIEPDEDVLRIRKRVDGVLVEHIMNEKSIASAIVLRLKLMAELNISERRLPQDGRFQLKINDNPVDVRLSTMPIEHGESVVMRLLESSNDALSLDTVGMPPHILKSLRHNVTRPHGVVLVTGPTGSGKTTTLYGCLSEMNIAGKKIITCEDPIEYSLPRICQCQINTKIDLTFARVLKAILRQDPDIIMVGEMRDSETASIGLRAAITGHLVLSTLHTNDSISTATRLIDMGVEPFLVSTALRAILAQRLVRRICPECKTDYQPNEEELAWLVKIGGESMAQQQFKVGRGRACQYCNNIGYRGRIGVYELLELRDEELDALRVGDTALFTKIARENPTYQPLVMSTLANAVEGLTTIDEVFRLAGEIE